MIEQQIDEVLEAYRKLLNDSLALDFCEIHGKDRVLILSNPDYKAKSRKIFAEHYIKEIEDIETLIEDLETTADFDSTRVGEEGGDDYSKILRLKMQAQQMRRNLLSLTTGSGELEEADALNVFYVALTPEEFMEMKNAEVHVGVANTKLQSSNDEMNVLADAKKALDKSKGRKKADKEIKDKTISYKDEDGEEVIEDVLDL